MPEKKENGKSPILDRSISDPSLFYLNGSAGDAVFKSGKPIHIVSFSDKFLKIIGQTRDDFQKMADNDVFSNIDSEDKESLGKVISTAEKTNGGFVSVFRIVNEDSEVRWIRVTAIPQESQPENFYGIFMDVTEEITNRQNIRRQIEYDPLTGCLNRSTFMQRTSEMLKNDAGQKYGMVCCDISRFKVINDIFGEKIGDKVLIEIGKRTREFSAGYTNSRLDADHFAFCIPLYMINSDQIIERFEGISADLGIEQKVDIYFGCYEIEDGNASVESMCDYSYMAEEAIKGSYLKHFAYYDDKLKKNLLNEQEIVSEMGTALKEGQFKIYLQPVFSATNEELCSAEALVRWFHPQKGMISPGSFIPVFERNGFVTEIDQFVWEEVCKYLNESKKNGKKVYPVSVNMSRMDMADKNLINKIDALTKKYDISPSLLRFEITESAYTQNFQQVLDISTELHKRGFKTLMDDFGSGYSALNILIDLPVDMLKIDRDFVTRIVNTERGGSVLGSVIRLARRLKIETVVEGVETVDQFKYLRGLGCDYIQGFYFSKPLPLVEFDQIAKTHTKLKDAQLSSSFILDNSQDEIPSEINKQRTVLLVDDSPINRALMKEILAKKYRIEEADNGRTAVEMLRNPENKVDIVLLDIVMPVMNGYEVLEEVRSFKSISTLPIIVLTSSETYENEIMALECGANDYLKKPYNPTIMNLKISNLLQMKDLTDANKTIENLIDKLPAGVMVLEAGRKIKVHYVSHEMASLMNKSEDKFMADYGTDFLKAVPPEERNHLMEIFSSGVPAVKEGETDFCILDKFGAVDEFHMRYRFIANDGSKSQYYCIVTNVL